MVPSTEKQQSCQHLHFPSFTPIAYRRSLLRTLCPYAKGLCLPQGVQDEERLHATLTQWLASKIHRCS